MNNQHLTTLDANFPTKKRVLLRVDFNVPFDEQGAILDPRRILAHKQTIEFLQAKNCQVILLAHLGQPQGQVDSALSFQRILRALQTLLNQQIVLSNIESPLSHAPVILLENLRFWPGEESNNADFAQRLANLGEIYVNDAFSVSHRAHASIVGVPQLLRSFAGPALLKEIQSLSKVLQSPRQPFSLLLGGKKVSDKLPTLQHLLPQLDYVLVGGASANTFAAAKGEQIDESYFEESILPMCRQLLESKNGHKIMLPRDYIIDNHAQVDIGPNTIQQFSSYLKQSKTIVWAGPMGKYENPQWNRGNLAMLKAIANTDGYTVIGGGDTLAALQKSPDLTNIDFLSLGGSAMLEFLAKETLVGIEAIANK